MRRYTCLIVGLIVAMVLGETGTRAQESVLPAPLYYIDGARTISRLAPDGVTSEQIVLDILPVDSFDVSPDGDLAYVVGNNLFLLETGSSEPQLLIEGRTLQMDEYGFPVLNDVLTNQISQPRFSPDGSRIAYGLGGINVYDRTAGTSDLILPNGEPDAQAPPDQPFGAQIHNPNKWTPDGSTLVVISSWIPEGINLGLLDVTSGEFRELLNEEGFVFCCGSVYFTDEDTILYSAATAVYPGEAGLWEINLDNQSVTNLTRDFYQPPTRSQTAEFHAAKLLDDGKIYFFFNVVDFETINGEFDNSKQLYRANPDGSDFELVNPNAVENLGQVVWAPDGSGAVVSAFVPGEGGGQELFWVPVDGGDIVPLVTGSSPQWGVDS